MDTVDILRRKPGRIRRWRSILSRLARSRCPSGCDVGSCPTVRRNTMKNTAPKVLPRAGVLIPRAVYAQPRPGNPTTATVTTKAEIDKISATEQSQRTRDENARVVDSGDGWSRELGIVHRAPPRTPP